MSRLSHFRTHARRRVNLPATVELPPGGVACGARVRDLGLGGACIDVRDADVAGKLTVGADVQLEVSAPSLWDPLVLKGKVVWLLAGDGAATRAGLVFVHDAEAPLLALSQLLGLYGFAS